MLKELTVYLALLVTNNTKFLKSYWKEHILLNANVRRYERILRHPMSGKSFSEINLEGMEGLSLPDKKKQEHALS